MPFPEFNYWYKYVSILKAREQLKEFESNCYSSMKREDMKKTRNNYYKTAVPLELDDSKIFTTNELAIKFKDKVNGK